MTMAMEEAAAPDVVAVLVRFVIGAAFLAHRGGLFGGKKTQVDLRHDTPEVGPQN